MTNQEFFNIVWTRAKDPVRAMADNGNGCSYLNGQGKSCFVGAALPKEILTQLSELGELTSNYDTILDYNFVEAHFLGLDTDLVNACQETHDEIAPEAWASRLREVAEAFDLEVPA